MRFQIARSLSADDAIAYALSQLRCFIDLCDFHDDDKSNCRFIRERDFFFYKFTP